MPRPKTKTDNDVLAATEQVLLTRGPHSFTLADVGRATGLSPATLLQRFGSKRGLLLAFARRAAQDTSSHFEEAARGSSSYIETLQRALLLLAAKLDDRHRFANSFALLLEDIRDDSLRAAAASQAQQIEAQIERLLRAASQAKEIECKDPAAFARLLYAAWNGALLQWALRGKADLNTWLSEALEGGLALIKKE